MKFDYVELIEPISAEAFIHCRKQLFPVFKNDQKYHPFLKEADYRKVDLEEDLMRYEDSYSKQNALVFKKDNPVGYFAGLTEDYFNYYLPCKEGSRADQYKLYARSLIKKFKDSKETDFSRVYDFFFIYLGLMREAAKSDFKKIEIENLSMFTESTDEDLLEKIKNTDFEFPIVPNGDGHFEIQIPKLKMKKVDVSVVRHEPAHEREYLYMHSVLLLENCMDQDGTYKETNNGTD